jgi:hypothetical protein
MPYERTKEADGLVITRVSGKISSKENADTLEDLEAFIDNNQLNEIIIHAPDTELQYNYEVTQNSLAMAARVFKGVRVRIAFVSSSDLIYSLCRQLQTYLADENILINVFRTEQAARNWIKESPLEA